MATLSMSSSTTCVEPAFFLLFSMSFRQSTKSSRIAWYCLEAGPKVSRAFWRLLEICNSCKNEGLQDSE